MPTSQHTANSSAAQHANDGHARHDQDGGTNQGGGGWKQSMKDGLHQLGGFWMKINNDWALNLASILAYNFLMSIFPILLVIFGIAGWVLTALSPNTYQHFVSQASTAIPGGGTFVKAALQQVGKDSGLVFAIGIVTAAISGSRLFITISNCFCIIFRLRGRDVIHQNLMAFGMLLLYLVLIPFVFLASIVPTIINRTLDIGPIGGFFTYLAGILFGFLVGALLFGAIYIVVPNRPVPWQEVWRGTLVAAGLLVIYELIFPIYEGLFLKPSNYGSLAGFAIVILTFFYYLGAILLIGAEVNSWMNGQRATAGDVAAVIHEVQAHNTTRGAAGVTAGTPAEDLQNGKGAAAMSTPSRAVAHERIDHQGDAQPPKYAEVGENGHGPTEARPRTLQAQTQVHRVINQVSAGKHIEPEDLPSAQEMRDKQKEADQAYNGNDDDEDQSGGTTSKRTSVTANGITVSYKPTAARPPKRNVGMLNMELLATFGAWMVDKVRSRNNSNDRHRATT